MKKEVISEIRTALINPPKYAVGDWGRAVFTCKNGITYRTKCYGRIFDMDAKCVLFIDNDNNEYLVMKNKFKFVKLPFVEKRNLKDLKNE